METLKIEKNLNTFEALNKQLQRLEVFINELSQSVNPVAEKTSDTTKGKTGDIQITRDGDKDYTFQIRTEEGWMLPTLGGKMIKFTDKPKEVSRPDAVDKSSLPKADYDSGWGAENTASLTHNLKTEKFSLTTFSYNNTQNDTTNVLFDSDIDVTVTTSDKNSIAITTAGYGSGYMRIRLWK